MTEYDVGQPAEAARRVRRRGGVRVALGAGVLLGALGLAVLARPATALWSPTSSAASWPPSRTAVGGQGGTAPVGSGSAGSGMPGSSGSSVPDGSTGSNSTVGTTSTQTKATAAQSEGVVLITTTLSSGQAAGTGMVIDSSGLVLTNYHVVQASTEVEVEVASTQATYTATVVGHDATHDVALLKLDGASGLDTVAIDSDAVAVSDAVTAVGNAQGQGYLSAASGEITDTSATVTVSNDLGGTETLAGVYATDAAAQPGDSGGPLYDAQGEVTAMTTAGQQTYRGTRGASAQTTASYAIPIERALAIVAQIERGDESGTVQIGPNAYLGIQVSNRTDAALVVGVSSGTPAEQAGLTQGSTITAIGSTAVSSQSELAVALTGHEPGDMVSISWIDAAGESHRASVTLAESPVN